MSSTSSQRIFTSTSTTNTSTVNSPSARSSGSENRSEVDQVTQNRSRTESGLFRFTASSTPFRFGETQNQHDFNPDVPLPSIERSVSSTTDRQDTPDTVYYTPSLSSDSHSRRQTGSCDAVLQELCNIRDLRLNSPHVSGSTPQRASRTPSINVTPSAPPIDSNQSSSRGGDSLVNGFAGLRLKTHRADSLGTPGPRESCSPSPLRRPRSGSGIREERHQIDSERPPETFRRMVEVQKALADARNLTRRLTTVLSSSPLHHKDGSSIQNLHRQATKLENFQLPSARIVGLVGDSSVGKSSLINSLLDKSDLARAVSDLDDRLDSSLNLTQEPTGK